MVILPLFPQSIKEKYDTLDSSLNAFLFTNFGFFWLSCGSFLADTEPRQFILRRLGRAWAGWRGETAGAKAGRGAGREWKRKRREIVTDVGETDRVEFRTISSNQSTRPRLVVKNVGRRELRRIPSPNLQTQVQVEVEVHRCGERGGGRGVLGAGRPVERRQGEAAEIIQRDSGIELEELFVARQQEKKKKWQTTKLGESPAQHTMTNIDI